jgi:hypothetical protein
MSISEDTQKKLTRLIEIVSSKEGVDQKIIGERVVKEFISEMETREQTIKYDDQEEKEAHIFGIIYKRYLKPTSKVIVYPLGIERKFMAKDKSATYTSTFFAFENGSEIELQDILLKNEMGNIINNVSWGSKYEVAGSISKTNDRLYFNTSTKFTRPVQSTRLKEVIKRLGVPKINISEANKNVAFKNEDGYPIKTDWRLIRGTITSVFKGTNKKTGEDFGSYNIVDSGADFLDEVVDEEGNVISRDFPVYCHPSLAVYPEETLCDFIGIISKIPAKDATADKPAEPEKYNMKAFVIYPTYG